MEVVLPPGLDPDSEVGLRGLLPFPNEDGKLATSHYQPSTSCSAGWSWALSASRLSRGCCPSSDLIFPFPGKAKHLCPAPRMTITPLSVTFLGVTFCLLNFSVWEGCCCRYHRLRGLNSRNWCIFSQLGRQEVRGQSLSRTDFFGGFFPWLVDGLLSVSSHGLQSVCLCILISFSYKDIGRIGLETTPVTSC